jgi:hypothetical protein
MYGNVMMKPIIICSVHETFMQWNTKQPLKTSQFCTDQQGQHLNNTLTDKAGSEQYTSMLSFVWGKSTLVGHPNSYLIATVFLEGKLTSWGVGNREWFMFHSIFTLLCFLRI